MASKFQLVVPCAGEGRRFVEEGINIPKPMLICGGKPIIQWGMESIDYSECNITFIVRKDHIQNYSIDAFLKNLYPGCAIVAVAEKTTGAVDTVLRASQYLYTTLPLIVYTPDTTFAPKFKPKQLLYDGHILTFKANSPNYSYSDIDKTGMVKRVVEKEVISDAASVGVYCFQSTKDFLDIAEAYVNECKILKHESHIAPLFNKILATGYKDCEFGTGYVSSEPISSIHIMGTPEEFAFCEEVAFKYIRQRKYALCCDHSGFDLKNKVRFYLEKNSIPFIDFGCYSKRDCDYNEYVDTACNYVLKEKDFFGIGCCRSGQGVNIYANKRKGIRAALVNSHDSASLAIRHNAANFFSLPESVFLVQNDQFLESVLRVIYTETFEGGRHQNRLMQHAKI